MPMSLEETITNCEEQAKRPGATQTWKEDHERLAGWLKELHELRSQNPLYPPELVEKQEAWARKTVEEFRHDRSMMGDELMREVFGQLIILAAMCQKSNQFHTQAIGRLVKFALIVLARG